MNLRVFLFSCQPVMHNNTFDTKRHLHSSWRPQSPSIFLIPLIIITITHHQTDDALQSLINHSRSWKPLRPFFFSSSGLNKVSNFNNVHNHVIDSILTAPSLKLPKTLIDGVKAASQTKTMNRRRISQFNWIYGIFKSGWNMHLARLWKH